MHSISAARAVEDFAASCGGGQWPSADADRAYRESSGSRHLTAWRSCLGGVLEVDSAPGGGVPEPPRQWAASPWAREQHTSSAPHAQAAFQMQGKNIVRLSPALLGRIGETARCVAEGSLVRVGAQNACQCMAPTIAYASSTGVSRSPGVVRSIMPTCPKQSWCSYVSRCSLCVQAVMSLPVCRLYNSWGSAHTTTKTGNGTSHTPS